MADLPAASLDLVSQPDLDALRPAYSQHKRRILFLDGSLRKTSFSRLLAEEAARRLPHLGREVKIFNPEGLPLPNGAPDTDPKVQEWRELSLWSEGHLTLLTRDTSDYLTMRYSERKEEAAKFEQRVDLKSI